MLYERRMKVSQGFGIGEGRLAGAIRRLVGAVAIATVFALLAVVMPSAAYADGWPTKGMGTQDDPYLIETVEDMAAFRDRSNSGKKADNFAGMYLKLTADIDLSEVEDLWTPISNAARTAFPFAGTFDGDGHTISGLTMDASQTGITNFGLFSKLAATGTVKNLRVEGTVYGKANAAGIVAVNEGTVEWCTSGVTVSGTNQSVGGIVGSNKGTVRFCVNDGAITDTASSYVGGVVGYNGSGAVENCINTASVSGKSYVGGIVGSNGGTTTDCYSTGDVTGTVSVGAVVGYKFHDPVNCYYLADAAQDAQNGEAACTAEQFASGEVTYKLNSGVTDGTQAFYQTCGEGLPAFAGDTVYLVKEYACPGDTVGVDSYGNTEGALTGEHSFTKQVADEAHQKTAATCTDPAVYYLTCATCDEVSDTQTFTGTKLDSSNHTARAVWDEKTATEHSAIWPCCGAVAIKATPHEWKDGSCTVCGYVCQHAGGTATCVSRAVCDTCGKAYGEVDPDNHTGKAVYTHTATQHTRAYDCCGAIVNKAAAHSFTWVTDKQATATTAGSKHEECTVCGYARVAVEIPATGTDKNTNGTKPGTSKIPQTGDDAQAAVAVMGTGAVAALGLGFYLRRKAS